MARIMMKQRIEVRNKFTVYKKEEIEDNISKIKARDFYWIKFQSQAVNTQEKGIEIKKKKKRVRMRKDASCDCKPKEMESHQR